MLAGKNVSFAPGASWQVGPAARVRSMVCREDLLQQLASFRRIWEGAAAESGDDIHAITVDLALILDDLEQIISGSAQF